MSCYTVASPGFNLQSRPVLSTRSTTYCMQHNILMLIIHSTNAILRFLRRMHCSRCSMTSFTKCTTQINTQRAVMTQTLTISEGASTNRDMTSTATSHVHVWLQLPAAAPK